MPPTLAEVRAALIDAVADRPEIAAAYVFGSIARERAGPLSDIDIALLIPAQTDHAHQVAAHVTDALSRRLHSSRVDVVLLPAVSPPLGYRIVRDGVLVTSRDGASVERFVADTVRMYLDFKPVREHAFERLREAILDPK